MIRNVYIFFNEILTKIYKCSILLLMLLEIRKLFSIESRKVFLDCFNFICIMIRNNDRNIIFYKFFDSIAVLKINK